MSELILEGQKFKIKGDQPTQKEQLAIETYLSGKKQKRTFDFDKELELMITPEDILTDAEKGKYNQDTENFLKSPGFMRIVSEVGLSIAGGLAGVALAPVSGGGSLVAAGALAARTARIVRPLLNVSAKTMQKIGYASSGAAIGGGAGAGIAQTFDPRESIVKEVARGAAQGAFGEVLGFGMAGGLAKAYNKITKGTIDTISGAERAVTMIARDKQFFNALGKIDETGEAISEKVIDDLIKGTKDKAGKIEIEGITPEQAAILKNPKKSNEMISNLKNRQSTFFKDIDKANITPGFITENNVINFLSSVGRSALIGSGSLRTAEQAGKMATLNGIDAMVESVLKLDIEKSLGKSFKNFEGFDDTGYAVGKLIQDGITKNKSLYEKTRNGLWTDLGKAVDDTIKLPDGSYNSAYDVIIQGAPKRLNVLKGNRLNRTPDEVSSLDDYIGEAIKDFGAIRQTKTGTEIFEMLGYVQGMGGRINFKDFRQLYGAIGELRPLGKASTVRAEILKRMEAMMATSPLPASVNNLRKTAAEFTDFGSSFFRDRTLTKILNTQRGRETVYKQIVASGKEDYYDTFFKVLDESKTTINGKTYDVFENAGEIKNAVRGQFFKDFLENSRDLTKQYPVLTKGKATKFLENHRFLLKKDGFLTKTQAQGLEDYTKNINILEGKIKAAGEAGSNPVMFMQLNAAGAFSQGIGVFLGGTGAIDPGTAAMFVAGPMGVAKLFSSPKLTKLLIEGLGGKGITIDSTVKLTRYMSQLSSGLVGEGVISSQEATAMMNQIEGNKQNYDTFFKTGILEGANAERLSDPENAPAIELDPKLKNASPQSQVNANADNRTTANIPLPNVTPSNLPMGGQQSNTELAQALNLFNKGGIVSAKKNF
tara:strand:+ start:6543 stop:9185 length:2643 start_codon:yes stop_codon:yes gene_type:complete